MNSSRKNGLIPQIEKKIAKKLSLLSLHPALPPDLFIRKKGVKKHRYFSSCRDHLGKESLFYARLHKNQNARKKFITEINFLKRIKRGDLKIKNNIPEIINWGIEADFEWLQREKIKPNSLANFSQKNFPKAFEKISARLSAFMFQVARVKTKGLGFEKFYWRNYFKSSSLDKLVNQGIVSGELSLELRQMVEKELPLLKKQNIYLSHGDLTLENILFDGDNFWVIDWERAHLNNSAYDITFLWMHLWKSRSSRKKLIEAYLKKLKNNQRVIFKKIFPLVASYLALGGTFLNIDKEKAKDGKRRKNFCIQVLKRSPQGFISLIKI